MRIVLGSQSKWRRKLLADAGVDFDCMAADIDEKAVNVHEDGSRGCVTNYLLDFRVCWQIGE